LSFVLSWSRITEKLAINWQNFTRVSSAQICFYDTALSVDITNHYSGKCILCTVIKCKNFQHFDEVILPVCRIDEANKSINIDGVVTKSLAAFQSLRGPRSLDVLG